MTPRPDQGARQQRAISKTALGAELVVPWQHERDTVTAVTSLGADGYHIVALETVPEAVDLYDWQPRWPLCLVFGHEKDGVTNDLAGRIETYVRIPMLGAKRSLNVATAAGVVLYELLRRRRYDSTSRNMPTTPIRTPAYRLIYDRLTTAARQRSRVLHNEVRGILESVPGDPMTRPDVDEILAQIAGDEHRAGRPLLTALVVTGKSIPGNIFFASARNLGALSSTDPTEEMRFWMAEEARVYAAWGE